MKDDKYFTDKFDVDTHTIILYLNPPGVNTLFGADTDSGRFVDTEFDGVAEHILQNKRYVHYIAMHMRQWIIGNLGPSGSDIDLNT